MRAKRIGMVAAALALLAGLGLWAAGPDAPAMTALAPLAPLAAAAQETAPAAPAIAVQDYAIGSVDAPVTFIEYASFTCPHCAHFHADVFGKLKADYIDTGKVRFEYREVYFDRFGLWAAMTARCGGEMRYFGIADILFDTQQEWAGTDDPKAVIDNLKKIGRTAGMEDAALDVCLNDTKMAEALVAHFEANFAADDVQGTPTLIINGVKHPNSSYVDLQVILDAELAK